MTPDEVRKAIYEASETVDPPEYNKDVDAYMRMASLKANAYGKLVAFLAERELDRMENREHGCICGCEPGFALPYGLIVDANCPVHGNHGTRPTIRTVYTKDGPKVSPSFSPLPQIDTRPAAAQNRQP